MKRRGLDSLFDGPLHDARDGGTAVVVHSEDEASVHHHSKIV